MKQNMYLKKHTKQVKCCLNKNNWWAHLWWLTACVSLSAECGSTPLWSLPGTHPQTQMSCWTPENPDLRKTTSASSSQLWASPLAKPCSCGKTPVRPAAQAPPTQCWSPLLACRSGSQSSSACWPPPRPYGAAAWSPAAVAGGQRTRRDFSAPVPPSASRPLCLRGVRDPSRMSLMVLLLMLT